MTHPIQAIQQFLKDNTLDGFLIFTSDDHGSEYVTEHFKARAFFSGFTGSAGTLLITLKGSYLWTDGRYFLQAASQLKQSGTTLMKMGDEQTDSIDVFIRKLAEKPRIGFDFSTAPVSFVRSLQKTCPNLEPVDVPSLIDSLWPTRPALKAHPLYALSLAECGESAESKLARTYQAARSKNCSAVLITSLDDIAWLTNCRSSDIACNPVFYSYLLIRENGSTLYLYEQAADAALKEQLAKAGIQIRPYQQIYEDIAQSEETILFDETKTNYRLYQALRHKVSVFPFPTTAFKAVKNATEIACMKEAHRIDGLAMVKFMYWLKTNVGKIATDELSAAEQLEQFRKENTAYIGPSFSTICGYQANGAIIHYSATEATNQPIHNEGLLLVDSGGQYHSGTTDITRTFVLGPISERQKRDFTLVLKSHIALATAIFPKGTCGYGLDVVARMPLYQAYLDYNHGTGHGVGALLNVHEGPQNISARSLSPASSTPFEPGMVTSDEPGLYFANEYGIRHENLLLCVEKELNDCNHFYGFEPLTCVPFDLDGIDFTLLNETEKNWLNHYHKWVYQTLAPLCDETLKQYLRDITQF